MRVHGPARGGGGGQPPVAGWAVTRTSLGAANIGICYGGDEDPLGRSSRRSATGGGELEEAEVNFSNFGWLYPTVVYLRLYCSW